MKAGTLGTRAKNNKETKIRKERKNFSSISLFLLPISFHLNFEALVPRVESGLFVSLNFHRTDRTDECAMKRIFCYSTLFFVTGELLAYFLPFR